MNLLDYLGELIPLDYMTPELQVMVCAVILVFMLRLLVGAFLGFFEKVFHG